jgi:hypothetical protein
MQNILVGATKSYGVKREEPRKPTRRPKNGEKAATSVES